MGMDYSLVPRIIDGLGKILDTKPGSPDEGTYVTEQKLADWIKGQTVVPAYYYNGVMYSDALHTTPITGQAGALYIDQDNNVLYRWDGAAWDAMSDNQLRQDILDGTVVAKKAECDEDGNNIKATYATKVEAANLQSQVDVLDHRVSNLEQAKGDYVVSNYKDGSITPSGKGAWAVVEGLRGVSRVENSLATDGNLEDATKWGTTNGSFSVATNIGTLTLNGATGAVYQSQRFALQSGHVYLCAVDIQASNSTMQVRISNAYGGSDVFAQKNTNWQKLVALWTCATTGSHLYPQIYANDATANDTVKIKNFVVTDLSVYFGGTIPSDADTIAEIQQNYPHLLIPSEYGVRIVDSSYVGVRGFSINIWDEVTEEGYINVTTGEDVASSAYLRSKNYTPCSPSTSYYLICDPSQITIAILFYNASGGYDSFLGVGGIKNKAFTTPSTASSFRIYFDKTYYNNDVQICLDSATEKTIYHPHILDTLSLTFQGKSAGSVYDQLETNAEIVQEIDGQKVTIYKKRTTERIGSYTFTGNEAGYSSQSVGRVYLYVSEISPIIKVPSSRNDIANILCGGWIPIDDNHLESNSMQISVGTSGQIGFCLTKTTEAGSVDALKTYLQTHPTTINFELADYVETLSDPIIDNTLLTEAGGRMATVQTGTVVDGSFDMGFINL